MSDKVLQLLSLKPLRNQSLLVVVGIYSVIVSITSVQVYYCPGSQGEFSFLSTLFWQSTIWYSLASLTPGMFWVSRRYAILDPKWHFNLFIHLLYSVLFAISYLLFFSFLVSFTNAIDPSKSYFANFQAALFDSFHVPFILYWATVGIYSLSKFHLDSKQGKKHLKNLLSDDPRYLAKLSVRSLGKQILLRTDDIDCIEAADYYSKIQMGEKSYLIRKTMDQLEANLDPVKFLRIHRSSIVNVKSIQELMPAKHGTYFVKLRNGKELKLARSRRDRLKARLSTL